MDYMLLLTPHDLSVLRRLPEGSVVARFTMLVRHRVSSNVDDLREAFLALLGQVMLGDQPSTVAPQTPWDVMLLGTSED